MTRTKIVKNDNHNKRVKGIYKIIVTNISVEYWKYNILSQGNIN